MYLRRNVRRFVKGRGPSITNLPPITIRPEVGGLMSPTAVRNVDFPDPLGPNRATTSPRRIAMLALRMATTSVFPLP